MSRRVSLGSADEYQAEEQAGVAGLTGDYQADEQAMTNVFVQFYRKFKNVFHGEVS